MKSAKPKMINIPLPWFLLPIDEEIIDQVEDEIEEDDMWNLDPPGFISQLKVMTNRMMEVVCGEI